MRLHPSTLKRTAALAGLAAVATVSLGFTSAPAQAGAVVPGIAIDVDGYGGGVGYVAGPAASYSAVLTATGGGTCLLANGAASIATFGSNTGNPARPRTDGALCHLYNAVVDYTIVATPLVGLSTTFYRTCVWELGSQICTVRGVDLL
ncbi:MAG: hypothetical protein ABIO67_06270 [Mycobacteriales bacterium]